ncbi:MAG: type 4a pilus biogenesis protein PilO [Planctomycetota bacterium]
MAKLNEKQKILAIVGGGLLVSLAAGAGIWWTQGLVDEVTGQIESDQKSIEEAQKKIDKINDLESQVIVLRENVDTYSKILPDDSEVTDFVRIMNRFATASEIELNECVPGPAGKRGKYSHYSYRIDMSATLWQFLKFINQLESYDRFIRVVSFNLKSADRDDVASAQQKGVDAAHKISLVVETYVYGGKNQAKNVEIPGYGKKRERLEAEIARGAQAVSLGRYDYVEKVGRRDIFIDPRPTVGGSGPSDVGRVPQQKLVDDFVAKIAEVREVYTRWQQPDLDYVTKETFARRLRESLTAIEQDAGPATSKISTQSLVTRWNNEVLQPVREMWRGLRGDARDPAQNALTEERLHAILAEMTGAVSRGEFEQAMKIHDDNADRLRFPDTDPRFLIALEIKKVREAVQAAREFNDIPMKIEGVVVVASGRSGILLNGRVYEEGDYLDDNLLLKSVGAEQADFVYRGFVLRRKW